jgi:Zn-dependent M32 family carboxypeptidase
MVMMSEGAAASRAAQKMVLAGIVHERKTDPEIKKLLGDVEGAGELDLPQAAVVREAKRKCAPSQ